MKVVCNINIEVDCPNAKTEEEAIAMASEYELPNEYISDSFEIVGVFKE